MSIGFQPFGKKFDNDISRHYGGKYTTSFAEEVLKDLPIGTKLEITGRPCGSVENWIKISENKISLR